jgi:acyl-CoA thioester hydrolase
MTEGAPSDAIWDYPGPYRLALTPAGDDIDTLGHVNNLVYARWCQEVAWRHSAALGLPEGSYRELGRAMAILDAHYEYLRASYFGEALEMGTWLTDSDGRLRMTRRFQLRRADDGATVFRGRWQLTCIRLDSGRPCRMPAEFLAAYEPSVRRAD